MEINQRNKQLDLLYDKYYDSIFERCFYYVNRKPIYFELFLLYFFRFQGTVKRIAGDAEQFCCWFATPFGRKQRIPL